VAGSIVIAWVMTIPCAAAVGALMELVTRLPAGDLVVFVFAGSIAATAFVARRWQTRRQLAPAPALASAA
jgi:predicted Kef-type K+ transport protein